jgi:hypothetical protein
VPHRLWQEKGRQGKGPLSEDAHSGAWKKRGEERSGIVGRMRDERYLVRKVFGRRKTRGEIDFETREMRGIEGKRETREEERERGIV